MNIIQTNIFLILLIAFKVNSSCLMASKELDDQCSTYCYQVVKPLLQYVNTIRTMTQEQNELQQTIKEQAETIRNLNELMKSKEMQLEQQNKLSQLSESHARNQQKLIDEYKMQSELKSTFYESCERRNRNEQKLIDQYEIHLHNLKFKIKSKDKQIIALQSENVKTKELLVKPSSSCLGRLTGFQMITLPATKLFIVPCESNLNEAGTGWTVIQRRKDGSVEFNRMWSEYKKGFGDLDGEFFLGLEKLHLLTKSQPHELFVYLENFANESRYAKYDNFVIGNETEFYKIEELGIYSGNAGDALREHKNETFSTENKFHHSVSNYCAKTYNSGWWFYNNGCYVNLNGRYAHTYTDRNIKSIDWNSWMQPPMKYAQMMIRPAK